MSCACSARQAGYALTDALTAMLILAMALGLSLEALTRARDAADTAWEVRRGEALLTYLLEAGSPAAETATGESAGFTWRVETSVTGAERPIEICRRAVEVRAARSGRQFEAATLVPCPLPAA